MNPSGSAEVAARDVFREYGSRIYHLALGISRNEKDAQDILQNTLLKVLRFSGRFRGRAKFSTWVYRIAYNEALQLLRTRSRLNRNAGAYRQYRLKGSYPVAVDWAKLPDEELRSRELRERVDSALRAMPVRYRMPLLLHRFEKLPLSECAAILRCSESALKTRLHRAYLMMKEEMRQYFQDRPEAAVVQEASCGIWTGFLRKYAMETLPASKRASFRAHLKGCDPCNRFLREYMAAVRIAVSLECRDIPPELKTRIVSFLHRKRS